MAERRPIDRHDTTFVLIGNATTPDQPGQAPSTADTKVANASLQGSLVDFMQRSPLADVNNLEFGRNVDLTR